MKIPSLSLLQFVTLLVLLGLGAYSDLRDRRIPNKLTLTGLCAGLVIGAFLENGIPMLALGGAGLALLLSFVVYALGGFGAGDAKLLTAVGAFVGPGGLLSVLAYGALAGGALALMNAVRRGAILGLLANTKNLVTFWFTGGKAGYRMAQDQSGDHSLPYGVAIAAGAVLAWLFPLSVGGLS